MYCIFHSRDLDGFMSAAIVKKALSIDGPIEFIGWDYGDPIPELEMGRKVVMVDVSFPMDDMYKMAIGSRDLIWIDHHKSAIKDFHSWTGGPKGHEFKAFLAREIDGEYEKKAACELAWEYFFEHQPMPEIVRMLGSYDSFRHIGDREEEAVFKFQYAARTYMSNPEECLEYLNAPNESIRHWVQVGDAILRYETNNAREAYKHRETFELVLPIPALSQQMGSAKSDTAVSTKKYKIAAVNVPRMNPKTYGIDFHADGYDLFMSYSYSAKAGLFTISIYSEKEDCSVVAKAFGGGGHAGAAGFQISQGTHLLRNFLRDL